jgi:hypothetical protein
MKQLWLVFIISGRWNYTMILRLWTLSTMKVTHYRLDKLQMYAGELAGTAEVFYPQKNKR